MSIFFGNRILGNMRILMDKAGDDKGGGGGGGGTDPNKEITDLKTQNADLLKRLEALEGKSNNPPPKKDDDPSLADKARQEREEKEKAQAAEKRLESALKFTLQSADFIKQNASLLPKTIEGIFAQAEKENYGSPIEKANAVKVGIVSEFFAVEKNLDLLTEAQKNALAEFKALTKTDKQERVQQVFDMVFEPAFESLKRIKKAEHLSKGLGDPTDTLAAYNNKMIAASRKHHLRETT